MTATQASPSTPTPAPGGGASPLVEVRGLSVRFGALSALEGLDLPVPARGALALIGPAGAGKSTLLLALNRMLDLVPGATWTGRILLEGRDIGGPGVDVAAVRRRLGGVQRRPAAFPLSVFENVAYGPRAAGVHDRRRLEEAVEGALRAAHLWDEVKDRLRDGALSLDRGRQQRLCIARALALDPAALLLDEPTAMLDAESAARVEALVEELKTRMAIVLATADPHEAARVSDETALLDGGRLVERGPTGRLFTSPREKRTEQFITGRFER